MRRCCTTYYVTIRCSIARCLFAMRTVRMLASTRYDIMLMVNSNSGWLYWCDHEGPQKVHQMVKTTDVVCGPKYHGWQITSSLYVYNKIDSVSIEFLDQLARESNTVVMSCELDLGIQDVVERCWQELHLMRIYTKRYSTRSCLIKDFADNVQEKEKNQTSARHLSSATSLPLKKCVIKFTEL